MAEKIATNVCREGGSFFGHPRGLSTLFMTELWERFSYYGMRALLVLFMTAPETAGGLGFSVAKAGTIYGMYTASVYLLSLPGGWLADRILGQRKAVLYGGLLIAAGNACLAMPWILFFFGGLIISALGTGLLKPNVSVMVGQLYGAGDQRRDAGFSIFYMGINLGAFLAPLACGYLGQRVNWHLGFALAAFGMLAGLIQYTTGSKYLAKASFSPASDAEGKAAALQQTQRILAILAIAIVLTVLVQASGLVRLSAELFANAMGLVLLLTSVVFFVWLFITGEWSPVERRRLVVVVILFVASALFWCMFEQAGSTLNLFAERSTNKTVLGFQFPASWLQSLNALFIIILAPVFAWLWVKLGRHEPSSPAKFSLGLLAAAAGFAVLALGAARAEGGVLVSPLWLMAVYLLHTVGELCLSPVGLSAMTKLAPARVSGLLMGVWFLSLSMGNYLGGRIASLYEALPLDTLFIMIAAFGALAGLLVALLVRPAKALMGDVK